MPIPIAQIPNAPRIGNPTLAGGVPGAPQISARSLMQEGLRQGDFDGAAKGAQAIGSGLNALGGAVGKVSTALQDGQARDKKLEYIKSEKAKAIIKDKQERMVKFQDETSLAAIEREYGEAYAAYTPTLPGTSESNWVSGWQKQSDELLPKLSEKYPLSDEGKMRLGIQQQSMTGRANIQLTTQATKSAVDRGTGELMAKMDRQMKEGDIEGLHETGAQLISVGAARQDQIETVYRQAAEQRTTNNLTAAMNQNPKLFAEDMAEYSKTGESETLKSPYFEEGDKAIKLERWNNIAQQNLRDAQSGQRQSVFDGIRTKAITNVNQIESAYKEGGEVLTSADLLAARNALMNSVGVLDVTKLNDIKNRVAQYDPKGDPDGTIRAQLDRDIGSELPAGEGGVLNERLKKISTVGKNSSADARVSKISTQAFNQKLFGNFIDGQKAEELTGKERLENFKEMKKAAVLQSQFDDAWTKYSTEHPNTSDEEATKWAYDQIKPMLETKEAGKAWYSPDPWRMFNVFGFSNAIYNAVKPDAPVIPGAQDRLKDMEQPMNSQKSQNPPATPSVKEESGMISPGNIDLNNRPVVKNSDGSISTVRSISIEVDGQTVLIPTVVGNKVVSDKEAINHYRETGENLGIFKDDQSATAYAERLHKDQEKQYMNGPKPSPAPTPLAGKPVAKTTVYSLGKNVGGPDELQDDWTNKGYSSQGQNLTPGVVAVNTKVYPLGTIFKDEATGEVYIASDKHGNDDKGVVDIYRPPNDYDKSFQPKLVVIGKESKVPTTVSGIREVLAKYGQVPAGESAVESLKRRTA